MFLTLNHIYSNNFKQYLFLFLLFIYGVDPVSMSGPIPLFHDAIVDVVSSCFSLYFWVLVCCSNLYFWVLSITTEILR